MAANGGAGDFEEYVKALEQREEARERYVQAYGQQPLAAIELEKAMTKNVLAEKLHLITKSSQAIDKLLSSEGDVKNAVYNSLSTRASNCAELEVQMGQSNAKRNQLLVRGLTEVADGSFQIEQQAFEQSKNFSKKAQVVAQKCFKKVADLAEDTKNERVADG